jgi:hypothetical protein
VARIDFPSNTPTYGILWILKIMPLLEIMQEEEKLTKMTLTIAVMMIMIMTQTQYLLHEYEDEVCSILFLERNECK